MSKRVWITGILAVGAGVAGGELTAAVLPRTVGPLIAVANRVVDLAPVWFVDLGKALFGTGDKVALVVGTLVLLVGLGAGLGQLMASRRPWGWSVIAALGVVAFVAGGTDAGGSWWGAAVVALVAAAITALVLTVVLPPRDGGVSGLDLSRRQAFERVGAVVLGIAVAGTASWLLSTRSAVESVRRAVKLAPAPRSSEVDALVAAAERNAVAAVTGISPVVVDAADFYRIDTAIVAPRVDPDDWSLTITGMVDREITYTYQQLLDRATTVAPVTLSCVSNPVGGDLVGNAIWQGVPLRELLDEAGVREGATQIASTSVDGWDCGFPVEVAFDGRPVLVAVGMNGEPLPVEHGFPARLVVAGLYGYVSATKWLSTIELTTFDDFEGYWVPRGWSAMGPVKTQSRIDTPAPGAQFDAGDQVPIAGVAWSTQEGIARVEVRVGDGEWIEAELGESLGPHAWIQWVVRWTAEPGQHTISVRATDGRGRTQTSRVAPAAPNGATGWDSVSIAVSA